RNPVRPRPRLAATCSPIWPLRTRTRRVSSTSLSGGRKTRSTRPSRGASSHSSRKAVGAAQRPAPSAARRANAPVGGDAGRSWPRGWAAGAGGASVSVMRAVLPRGDGPFELLGSGHLAAQLRPDGVPVPPEGRVGARVLCDAAVEVDVEHGLDPPG